MRVLLTAHGSRGDVYPMIAVASRFRDAGHEVTMMTQTTYQDTLAERSIAGLFIPEEMRDEMARMNRDGGRLSSPLQWAQQSLREEFRLLKEASKRADLLICTNNEFSVSSIAEARGIPAYRVAYLPSIPGKNVPPLIPWQNLPSFLAGPAWTLINKGLDLLALKVVNRHRATLGLAPVKSLAPHFMATYRNLFAINDVLSPPHPSWPAGSYRYCGYAFEQQEDDLPPEVEAFLESGDPPIYFGFGSVNVDHPRRLTALALKAAERAGCRLVLSRGWTGLGRLDVPHRALLVDDLPHDRLFPRLAGVCHHGGSGTTHRAARAGVPQFIMPLIVDQFFWGKRIYELCLGPKPLSPKKLTVEALADVFWDLKQNPTYRGNARRLAATVARDGGVDTIYDVIQGEMAQLAA